MLIVVEGALVRRSSGRPRRSHSWRPGCCGCCGRPAVTAVDRCAVRRGLAYGEPPVNTSSVPERIRAFVANCSAASETVDLVETLSGPFAVGGRRRSDVSGQHDAPGDARRGSVGDVVAPHPVLVLRHLLDPPERRHDDGQGAGPSDAIVHLRCSTSRPSRSISCLSPSTSGIGVVPPDSRPRPAQSSMRRRSSSSLPAACLSARPSIQRWACSFSSGVDHLLGQRLHHVVVGHAGRVRRRGGPAPPR